MGRTSRILVRVVVAMWLARAGEASDGRDIGAQRSCGCEDLTLLTEEEWAEKREGTQKGQLRAASSSRRTPTASRSLSNPHLTDYHSDIVEEGARARQQAASAAQ